MIRLRRGARGARGAVGGSGRGQAAGRGAGGGVGGVRGGRVRARAAARIPWECRTGTVVVAAPAWGLSGGPEITEDDDTLDNIINQNHFAPSQYQPDQDEEDEADGSEEQPRDHNNTTRPL